MPTGACRPEWTEKDHNEEGRPHSRRGADSLIDCPGAYRPPTAQECQIPDVQEWLDLCA
jgi:hypothetical protein